MTPEDLAKQLRNIGPVTSRKLLRVGIDSLEKLKEVGVEETYRRIASLDDFCRKHHAAYLYALEGAILGCDWREVPADKKKAYKAFTEKLRKEEGFRLYFNA